MGLEGQGSNIDWSKLVLKDEAAKKEKEKQDFLSSVKGAKLGDMSADQLKRLQDYKNSGDKSASDLYSSKYGDLQSSIAGGQDISKLDPAQQAELQRRADEITKRISNTPTDGRPAGLDWNYLTNLDGSLQDKYKLGDWKNVNADTTAMNQYGQEALRGAGVQSQWAKAMTDKMGITQKNALDRSGQQAGVAQLQAQNQLAQNGGLSGAARERMAMNTSRNALLDKNNIMRQGQLDRYNLASQDESNRMSQLQNYQGMANTQADIAFKNQQMANDNNKYNLGNLFNENNNKRMFDTNQYNQQMQSWAAGKTADAQRASAGRGGKK